MTVVHNVEINGENYTNYLFYKNICDCKFRLFTPHIIFQFKFV